MSVDFSHYLRILRTHAPESDPIPALEERLHGIVATSYQPVTAGSAGLYYYSGKTGDDADIDDDDDDDESTLNDEESFWKEELLFYAQSSLSASSMQSIPLSLMRRNSAIGVFPFPFFLQVFPISPARGTGASNNDTDASEEPVSAIGNSRLKREFNINSSTDLSDYGDDTTYDDTDATDGTDATDIGEDTDTVIDSMGLYGDASTSKPIRSLSSLTDTDTDDVDIQVSLISCICPFALLHAVHTSSGRC